MKDENNPWNVSSLYNFQFFNCPTCSFMTTLKQQFVDHAYLKHVECVEFLSRIQDGSLEGLDCPWNDYFIKEEFDPLSQDQEYQTIEVKNDSFKDDDISESESDEEKKSEPCDLYSSNIASKNNHDRSTHISIIQESLPIEPKHEKTVKLSFVPEVKDKKEETKRTISCDVCGEELHQENGSDKSSSDLINDHKSYYHDLKCKLCGKLSWSDRKGLDNHIYLHHSEKKCPHCPKSYSKQNVLKRHIETVHENKEQFPCIHCSKKFQTFEGKLKHEKSCGGSFTCEKCGMNLKSKTRLQQHMTKHHGTKENVCDQCPATFVFKSELKYHIDRVHLGKKKFQCEHCGLQCGGIFQLTTHIKAIHEKLKDKRCDLCGKEFSREFSLKQHKLAQHNIGKKFECEQCDKKFSNKFFLNSHVTYVHDGIRAFSCKFCEKTFTYDSNLKQHVKVVHEKIREFKCQYCDRDFVRNLKKHIENSHKMDF